MARRVLGNDPFERGTVQREATSGAPPKSKAKAKAVPSSAKSQRRLTTELQIPDAPKVIKSPRPSTDKKKPARQAPAPTPAAVIQAPEAAHTTAQLRGNTTEPTAADVEVPLPSMAESQSYASQSSESASHVPLPKPKLGGPGFFARTVLDTMWKVTASGTEHLPLTPYIAVANVSGSTSVCGALLRQHLHRTRPSLPAPHWLYDDRRSGVLSVMQVVKLAGAMEATLDNAVALVSAGRPVIVFPRGLNEDAEQRDLTDFGVSGFIRAAQRLHVPIVPISIHGGERALRVIGRVSMPFGSSLPIFMPPQPSQWSVAIHEPITVESVDVDDLDEVVAINRSLRAAIGDLQP